ncbi:hypothetical protein Tco_0700547 [Tanacetum coccineum]
MKEVQPYKLMALYVSWLVKLLKFDMKVQSLLLLPTSTIPVVTSTILVYKRNQLFKAYGLTQSCMADSITQEFFSNPYSRNCGLKANVVVISQTYLRHLFEEGNLSAHIILRSHPLVGFSVSRCPPGQALQIFRWLWKNPIFTLDFLVVRKSSHVTVDIFVLALSPPTIPKVKIPEDTLRQVVGAVRIDMLRDVASGRDLKKFLAVSVFKMFYVQN